MTSPHHKPLRRVAAPLALLAILLSACSSEGGGDWGEILKAARDSWDNRDAPVGLSEASGIPYATLGLRIDGGREQILILAIDTSGERLWTSAARIAISTRGGRIVRTAGFGADLDGYVTGDGMREDWSKPHTYGWTADFADLGYFSVPVICDVRPAGRDPITILGQEFDTVRVEETCTAEKLDWTFKNTYWVSAQTGRVWRTIEQVHPRGPVLDIEILRPPLSAG